MKVKRIVLTILVLSGLFLAGCAPKGNESTENIITAKDALAMIGQENVVLVDMQAPEDYAGGHLEGAVNIPLQDIVINVPVDNMMAPKAKIEDTLGKNGIGNDSLILVYDNKKNMEAARLWFTVKAYGHEQVKVISGGVEALKKQKATFVSEPPSITAVTYQAKDKNKEMLATVEEVRNLANDPVSGTVILDTRTKEEYAEGRIPGAKNVDFSLNNYSDGTYKTDQDIYIMYYEEGMKRDTPIILYCKTSVRATQTYLALHNAGYTNLKVYDGAWLEWSASPNNPIEMPEGAAPVESDQKDNS